MKFLEKQNAVDYAAVARDFPVRESTLTQVSAGDNKVDVSVMTAGSVSIARSEIMSHSVFTMVPMPSDLFFWIPLAWQGDLKVNGCLVAPSQLHTSTTQRPLHIAGRNRRVLNATVPRIAFTQTLNALLGNPDKWNFDELGAVTIPAETFARLREALRIDMERGHRIVSLDNPAGELQLSKDIEEALMLACLEGVPEFQANESLYRQFSRIVRAAEERFAEASPGQVSLADLCEAACVSKSTLYRAFHSHCDMSPLAYFHKRKLAIARSLLVESSPWRGAVKHAALNAGLTELGRFSVEYRQLFGEPPSTTLSSTSL